MEFTYNGYRRLLALICENGYAVAGYDTWQNVARCVIPRHDIDTSLEDAVKLGELEAEAGVRVSIGHDCEIKSATVIGHDGYGYTEDEHHRKTMIRHYGGVTIGDDVLIGENVCISRGAIDDTILESGVKIDALGHIAHNCWFEQDSAMSAPCSVSGSVHIGRNGYLAGNIIRNQCTIGENAFVGLGAVVVKDVEPGQTVVGNPAKPFVRRH